MPIDASIVSGLRAPSTVQLADPLEQYGKSLTLRHLIGQGDLQQMQLKQAQQADTDDQMVRQAYMQGGDPATIRARLLAGGGYKAAQALDTADLARRKGEADLAKDTAAADKAKAERDILALQHGASVLSKATDQNSYDQALQVMDLLSPGAAANIRKAAPTFDPATAQRLAAAGLTHAQQLEAQNRVDTLAQTKVRDTEAGRHNVSSEAISRANTGIAGGNLSLARERFNFEKDQPRGQFDSERGVMVDPRTGVATPVTMAGAPLGPKDKKLTESEGKAGTFGMRARAAADILDSVGKAGAVQPGLIKRTAESVPLAGGSLGTLTNFTQSAPQQQVEQAQRDFVNAVLRLESGASISPAEFENAKKQYFPQPGDSPQVIEQKRANRETEIAGLTMMAGAGGKNIRPAAAIDPNATPTPEASIPGQRTAQPRQTAAVKIRGDDGYNALPKGARYVGPDGIERVK